MWSCIDDVALVVLPGQKDLFKRYLSCLSDYDRLQIPSHITYVEQPEPLGFGDAVLKARNFVGKEPFVLLLGDHVHVANVGTDTCLAQVLNAFAAFGGKTMVGVHRVPASELDKVGVVKGKPLSDGVFHCVDFIEKPDLKVARKRLSTPGLPPDVFLGHCGIYAFTPRIFDCLLDEERYVANHGGEVELAGAQARLLEKFPDTYYLMEISGRAYDTGVPTGYFHAMLAVHELQTAEKEVTGL